MDVSVSSRRASPQVTGRQHGVQLVLAQRAQDDPLALQPHHPMTPLRLP
jgi:hypothetical protein